MPPGWERTSSACATRPLWCYLHAWLRFLQIANRTLISPDTHKLFRASKSHSQITVCKGIVLSGTDGCWRVAGRPLWVSVRHIARQTKGEKLKSNNSTYCMTNHSIHCRKKHFSNKSYWLYIVAIYHYSMQPCYQVISPLDFPVTNVTHFTILTHMKCRYLKN